MARGTVSGETPTSQAATPEYRENHNRVFGERQQGQRGRWIWDESVGRLVRAEDYVPQSRAIDGPVMVDRFYENTVSTDGVDIGSRRKHRAYMKERGLAPADDFSPGYYARLKKDQKRAQDAARRDTIARAVYQKFKP
jgi:hypothetical protein